MRTRAQKFLAWYDALSAHEKRLFADTVRELLVAKGASTTAALNFPHAAVACVRSYIEDADALAR